MGVVLPQQSQLSDGTALTIRTGRVEDAEQLLEHVDLILTDGTGMVLGPREFSVSLEEERAWIEGLLEHPTDLLLVAEHAGRLVANLDFHAERREQLRHGGEFGMAVAPGWRGRGLGTLLLEALISWASEQPEIERVGLKVIGSNEAGIGLYRKFGFVEEGRRVNYIKTPDGSHDDDVLMYRPV